MAAAPTSDNSSVDGDIECEAFTTFLGRKATASSASPSRRARDPNDPYGEGRQPDFGPPGVNGEAGAGGRGGEGCDVVSLVHATPHRWVDYCTGSSSSCSSSSRSSSATTSSSEDMRSLLPGRQGARAHASPSEFLPDGAQRCAPGFEGAGDGGGLGHGGGGPFPPIERQRPRDFSGKSSREEHHHIHRSREGKARRVRRLPLSVFTDYPPSFTSSRAQQVERRTDNHATLGIATTASEFAWFVLVHGCLCEAPLAVIEGLVRGPLYLAAAAWTSIVSLIGSPSHVEQRAELSQHAAALAREGVLFLVAAITLAVPFSTSFTVYGEAMERSDDWDVRTVPTFLGAVDPLRFFVFAFGQAGELAANGRPEPLRHLRDNSQLSQWTVATSSTAADGGRREMPDACFDGSAHFSPPASYVGVIAAQSMDTDQLGVGILHPPQEIRLRFSRVGAAARRAAVSAYRGLATRMASVYRRLPHYGVVMARITGRFSNSIAGAGHSAATRKTDQGACVV